MPYKKARKFTRGRVGRVYGTVRKYSPPGELKFVEFEGFEKASIGGTWGGVDETTPIALPDPHSKGDQVRNAGGVSPNDFPKHIQFGSRCAAVRSAQSGSSTDCDGSWTVVLKPARAVDSSAKYDQYSGKSFFINTINAKINFFNTATGTGTTYNTLDLWDQESIIRVLLVLEKNTTNNYTLGSLSGGLGHLNASRYYASDGADTPNVATRDKYINQFPDHELGGNVRVLKKWDLELSAGASGSEAYLPFSFYHKFKKPLKVECDTATTGNVGIGAGEDIKKNRLSLLFVARGAVAMTMQVRMSFYD
jgi:hypothetical protein